MAQKKQQQQVKKQMQNERKKIRKLCEDAVAADSSLGWELDVCIGAGEHQTVALDILEQFTAELTQLKGVDAVVALIHSRALATKESQQQEAEAAKLEAAAQLTQRLKREEEEAAAKETEWTSEERRLLVKAVKKFPAGTNNRWGRIAEFLGGQHTEQEVIKAIKHGLPEEKEAFAQFLEKRDESASASKEQAKADGIASDGSAKAWAGAKHAERMDGAEEQAASKREAEARAAAAKKKVSEEIKQQEAPPAVKAAADDWTPAQQKALEVALKKYPASDKERWEKVAAEVGKTKKEVVKRCKEIRDKLKK